MPNRTYIRCLACLPLLACLAPQVFAQSTMGQPEVHPGGIAYSSEQSAAGSPQLAQKESELRSELKQHPDSAELLYALGLVLRLENNPRASLPIYTQAATHRTPTAGELRSVALDYVLLNDFDDAIHWLERAVQMSPNDVEVLYSLGRCYYSRDRYTDAAKMYKRVLAIDPKNLKAEENLGLAYDSIHSPDKAEDALRTAAGWADENGTDEWPYLDYGSFLLDEDRAKEAAGPLRIATHIRQSCAACHEKLGRALLATHDEPEGLAELEKATQLDPKNPKIHFEFGRALRQAGQMDRAMQELSLSQKLYSTHSEQ
jgi:tetratricopeptide (TPR) repeat protein